MKNSFDLAKNISNRFTNLLEADQREIDNPDPYRPACRNYMDRIETIVAMVKKLNPPGASVAEIGCAQGNMSLLLAEKGYRVQAIDINPEFLEYSKLKYERGDMTWLHSNLEEIDPSLGFDALILGEIIEHCAWPEKVIANALNFLKPGGVLIVTTPNAEKVGEHLPTFSTFNTEEKRRELEKRQFGPAGEDHLFLFTMREMKSLVPEGVKLIDWGYLGGSLALNSRTHHLFRVVPLKLYRRMIRWMSGIPILNRFSFHNIYMVIQKPL
jgi:2-polyprenyl-3-methyl-5-hydroxy-6-metoxy-1,4-benzoquinol methylase